MTDSDPYNQEEPSRGTNQDPDYMENILGNEEEEFWKDEQEI